MRDTDSFLPWARAVCPRWKNADQCMNCALWCALEKYASARVRVGVVSTFPAGDCSFRPSFLCSGLCIGPFLQHLTVCIPPLQGLGFVSPFSSCFCISCELVQILFAFTVFLSACPAGLLTPLFLKLIHFKSLHCHSAFDRFRDSSNQLFLCHAQHHTSWDRAVDPLLPALLPLLALVFFTKYFFSSSQNFLCHLLFRALWLASSSHESFHCLSCYYPVILNFDLHSASNFFP